MKNNKIYSFIFSSLTLLFISYGLIFIGTFSSNKIFITVPNANTAPDFSVIFGQSKLKGLLPDSLKNYKFDYNDIWVNNKNYFFNFADVEYLDYYYTVTGNFVGKKRECDDTGDWNPLIKIDEWHKVHFLVLWTYIILTILSLIFSVICIRRLTIGR